MIIDKFKRKNTFDYYNLRTNPFLIVVNKIEITNLIKYCKIYKSHYAVIAYAIHLAINELDNFKYRVENGNFTYYKKLNLNFVQNIGDDIAFFAVKNEKKLANFIKNFHEINNKVKTNKQSYPNKNQGEIWYSCTPWFNFTSIITPFDKTATIPQIIWDKFIYENNKVYVNLMIQIHHGFADGSHIGKFFQILEEKIKDFDKYII